MNHKLILATLIAATPFFVSAISEKEFQQTVSNTPGFDLARNDNPALHAIISLNKPIRDLTADEIVKVLKACEQSSIPTIRTQEYFIYLGIFLCAAASNNQCSTNITSALEDHDLAKLLKIHSCFHSLESVIEHLAIKMLKNFEEEINQDDIQEKLIEQLAKDIIMLQLFLDSTTEIEKMILVILALPPQEAVHFMEMLVGGIAANESLHTLTAPENKLSRCRDRLEMSDYFSALFTSLVLKLLHEQHMSRSHSEKRK